MVSAQHPHHHHPQSLLLRALPTTLPRVEVWKVQHAGAGAEAGGIDEDREEGLQPRDPRSLGDGRDSERFGYNDDAPWRQELSYTRWVQPLESELAKQVEYDMDDGDREWLDEYNRERIYEGNDALSYEFFEIVIDQLEKSWFELQKHIPKPASTLPAEDSTCAICDDGECEASNAIVFCDGCNLAVHQDCYGVPYIPEGQWLCRKCTVSPDRPVTCVLCPTDYGAFKQTTNGKWAHLLCAIWINETGVSNTVYMEPIDGVEAIPKGRWKLVCYLCKKRTGACIQCSKGSCYAAYHVTCAQEYGLHLKLGTTSGMTTADGSPGANVSYCHKHSPNYAQLNQGGDAKATEDDPEEPQSSRRGRPPKNRLLVQAGGRQRDRSETPGTPSAPTGPPVPLFRHNRAASNKSVAPAGPPIVPQYIYDKLWEYVRPLKCKQKPIAVRSVCRYWSLKRESRRGAPLLKRLHLEPWTASGGARGATDLEKEKKLELVFLLRNDLEKVRTLTELVRKREREKLRRTQLLKTIVEQVVFPQSAVFKQALQAIMQQDKNGLFAKAVDEAEVPDYYTHIKQPMWWGRIAEKIDSNVYLTADEFELDVNLVLKNALSYNRPEDRHAKVAQKLQLTLQPILRGLDALDDPSSNLHALHAAMPSLLDTDTVNGLSRIWYPAPTPEDVRKAAAAQKAREEALAEAARLAALDPILSSTPARRSLPQGIPMDVESVKQEDGTTMQGPAASGSRKRKRIGRDAESATPGPRPSTRKQPAALLPPLPPPVRASNQPTPNFEELEGEARNAAILAAQKREKMLEAKRVAERERKRRRKEAEALAKERAQKADKPQAARNAPSAHSAAPAAAELATNALTAFVPFPTLELPAENTSAAAEGVTAGPSTSKLSEPHTEAEQAARQSPPLQVVTASEPVSEGVQPLIAEATAAPEPAISTVVGTQPLPEPATDINDNTKDVVRSDVTNHDSFLLFNTGWVLPDGVRRRAKSAQIDGLVANTSLSSSGSRSGAQPGSVGSGRSSKTSSPTTKTAPLPTVPLPTLEENGQSNIFAAAPPAERVQTLSIQASDSDLSVLEDSQSQPQPSTCLQSVAGMKPQEASASALPATDPIETDEPEPDAPLAHPSSALSDISDLSDLSDPDEEAKEAVSSSRGPTTLPRRTRSRRESTAASATPRSHYAPSRTRGMLAAEAALLRATPSREASTAPAAPAEEAAVTEEVPQPDLREDPVETAPAPAPTPAPRRRPRASAAASTSATPIAGAGDTSMSTATPARGAKAMDRLAELLPALSYDAVKEIGDYELVWARKNSREAFWPAEVCIELDDEDREIPEELLANAPEGTLGRKMPKAWRAPPAKERDVLVQYFGHKRPWEIVKVGNLAKLRENQELDDLLRTSAAMPSKSKRSAHTIAKAYEEAVAIAEVPEDLVEENSQAGKRKR